MSDGEDQPEEQPAEGSQPNAEPTITKAKQEIEEAHQVNGQTSDMNIDKVHLAQRVLAEILSHQTDTTTNVIRLDEALQKTWPIRDTLKTGNECTHKFQGICTTFGKCRLEGPPDTTNPQDNKSKMFVTVYANNDKAALAAIGVIQSLANTRDVTRTYDAVTLHC